MTKTFKYSVLKYIHSQFLGEELNIGVLFFFSDPNLLLFKYSRNSINRLKKIYKTFNAFSINQYLKAFEERAMSLNNQDLPTTFEEIISIYFLVKDASTLQFPDIQSVIQYSNDIEAITNQYFDLYFPEDSTIKKIKTVSDSRIASNYKNLLIQHDKTIKNYLRPSIEIKNEKAFFKSDLVWVNGTVNAVKGVSFDLKEEQDISDKALLLNAKLNYLSKEALIKNIRFDLLVTAPQEKKLFTAYENALQILNDINANKQIITESELETYTLRTIKEVQR